MREVRHILISRTDSIGDVVLTLPMAGALKKLFPASRISFLGKTYTKDVVAMSCHVDDFINWDDLSEKNKTEQAAFLRRKGIDCILHIFPRKEIALLAKKAKIPVRIGTTNRIYHWPTCNRLVRLSRKNSDLHEAQLNLKLIVPLGAKENFSTAEIRELYGFEKINPLPPELEALLHRDKKNIILHPRSRGSAREWGIDNFERLVAGLDKDKFRIFISGTAEEGKALGSIFSAHPEAIDLTGLLSLQQFISFIAGADVMVAASTGPLHIAAALGKKAVGLFVPLRPIHPGRWAPIGKNAHVLVAPYPCHGCKIPQTCACIRKISVQQAIAAIEA